MDVRLPDGTIIQNVPEGTSKADLASRLKANGMNVPDEWMKPAPSVMDDVKQGLGNLVAGAVRGAGSIGATIVDGVRDLGSTAVKSAPPAMRPPGAEDVLQAPRGKAIRTGMDSSLADMGAEPDSLMYQGGKLGGEIAGTLPIGGAVGGVVGKVAPRLGQAITSGGFSTGSRVAPGVVAGAQDAGIRAAGGAINGALTAAAVNPEDAGTGAAIGAALPVATKVVGAVGHTIGTAVSPKMARADTVNRIGSKLGNDAQQVVADIQTYYPNGAQNIPVSAAAVTQHPVLSQMEQGSRLRSAPEWLGFDVKQSKAAYDNVLQATKEAEDMAARAAARRDNWQQAWDAAEQNLKPRLWRQRMTQFGSDLRQAELSGESSNPAVRSVLDAINAEMDRLGPNFGVSHLQQMRANLNGKVNPLAKDAFASAPRDNPAIISLKKEMDDILNTVTGGKWQKVIEGYAKDSEALHASKAAQKVRNAYTDPETGRIVSPVIATDVPRVTAANLNRAMNAARLPDKSLALSPQANQQLEATLEALRRQGAVQDLKRTATAGGGSDTIPNAIASGLTPNGPGMGLVAQALGLMRNVANGKRDAATAELLSRPDELAKALEQYLRPVVPNRGLSLFYRGVPAIAADQ